MPTYIVITNVLKKFQMWLRAHMENPRAIANAIQRFVENQHDYD